MAEQTAPLRPRGQATRARLMDAGAVVFASRGFHATRVDDIVRKARSAHGTFYLYFSSKDDLFAQLVRQVAEELDAATRSLPEICDDAEGRAALEEWMRSFMGVYRRYGELIRTWTDAEGPLDDPAEGNGMPDVLGAIATGLAARVRVRSSRNFDPEVAALVCVAMVERLNYLLATGQLDAGADEAVSTMAAVVLDAFFGPGH